MNTATAREQAQTTIAVLREQLAGLPYGFTPYVPLEPIVLPDTVLAELASAADRILALLLRTAREMVGEDPEMPLAGYHGLRELLQSPDIEEDYADLMARPDIVLQHGTPQFMEFNISSAIGGLFHTRALLGAWRHLAPDQWEQDSPDPADTFASAVRRVCACRGLDRVLVVGKPRGGAGPDARIYREQVDALTDAGLDARYLTLEEFGPAVSGPIGRAAVLCRCGPETWLQSGFDARLLRRVIDGGGILLSPVTSRQAASKATLARPSQEPEWLGDDEREAVRRYVPWTRPVGPGALEFDGESALAEKMLNRHRERLVLKKANGRAGQHVHIGLRCPAETWSERVHEALAEGGWVVQQHVVADMVPTRVWEVAANSIRSVDVAPVYGHYRFLGRAAGCAARYNVDDRAARVGVKSDGSIRNVACRPGPGGRVRHDG